AHVRLGLQEPRMASQSGMRLPSLPTTALEAQILDRSSRGDWLVPCLYLHLYEEAATMLPSISVESSRLLDVDPAPANRLQRQLAVASLAGLGKNYSLSTYYSEIFLKTLPEGTLFSMPEPVIKALFPWPYQDQINKFSRERGIDPMLVLSIMKQESKFK